MEYNKHCSKECILECIIKLLLCALTLVTLYNIFGLSNVEFYRQDSIFYVDNYEFKFVTEGRWLNLLTFNLYKYFPAWFLIFGYFLSAMLFFYLIAYNVTKVRLLSFIFALLCINSPPFYSLLLWPVVPFSSYFMLLTLYFYRERLKQFEVFMLCGVFSFGIISNLHFLAPLIYIDKIIKQTYKKNLILFMTWVLTFIVGFIVANAFVYLVTLIKSDSPSFIDIEAQTWRLLSNDGGSSLIYNIKYVFGVIISDVTEGGFYFLILGFIINYRFTLKNKINLKLIAWSLLIYISFYSSNILHGIRIDFRSVASAFIGLSLFHLISRSKTNSIYLLLCISFFSYDNYRKIEWYSDQVDSVKERFVSFQEDLSKGGDLAIVYWNPEFYESFNLSTKDKPYGLIDLNNFPLKQSTPYLIEQGYDKVEVVIYDVDYTGNIRYERNEETVHIYME
ncbi:hypothetical protein BCU83_18360 [Vibrio breoganii]|uniref:hypothetical protein n=1 Tax=Vibrio breoganii TaxID=553239 RepID=UPI000C82D744|nr:hypothetical protein [Vibrio breoganii]PMG85450.1 hypothetical protein BCU83_18360 [Vibrio breoganii]